MHIVRLRRTGRVEGVVAAEGEEDVFVTTICCVVWYGMVLWCGVVWFGVMWLVRWYVVWYGIYSVM